MISKLLGVLIFVLFRSKTMIANTVPETLQNQISKGTYIKIIECLKKGRESINASSWSFPEDAEAHYQGLLKLTSKWRDIEQHRAFSFHNL